MFSTNSLGPLMPIPSSGYDCLAETLACGESFFAPPPNLVSQECSFPLESVGLHSPLWFPLSSLRFPQLQLFLHPISNPLPLCARRQTHLSSLLLLPPLPYPPHCPQALGLDYCRQVALQLPIFFLTICEATTLSSLIPLVCIGSW